jgi:DNA polymerase III epsilon subunit-like protein
LIRVIDIETTGIDPATDAIIEIASVDMVRGGGITNAMGTLVRPGKPIPPGASAIHHIIDEDLRARKRSSPMGEDAVPSGPAAKR